MVNETPLNLQVDSRRYRNTYDEVQAPAPSTGIFVRAQYVGKWDSFDIGVLTKESLISWLRSDGAGDCMAERCLLALLGHDR